MALTPDQISRSISAINQLYGAGTLPETTTEVQLQEFAAGKLRALETKLNEIDSAAAALGANSLYESQGSLPTDGLWDETTADSLAYIESLLAMPNLPDIISQIAADKSAEARTGQSGHNARNRGEAADAAVRNIGTKLQAFNPDELAFIRELNDALSGTNTAARLQNQAGAAVEADIRQAANSAAPAARDWINANRGALNALLPSSPSPEERAAMEIPEIPAGNVSINTPAFASAASRTLMLYDLLDQNSRSAEFPAGAETALAPIRAISGVVSAYNDLYSELGPNAALPTDLIQLHQAHALLSFKLGLAELDRMGVFGNLPDFDPKQNPLDVNDPAFIATWRAATQVLKDQGLTPDVINQTADSAIQAILNDQNIPQAFKDQLYNQPDIFTKIELLVANPNIPQSTIKQVISAVQLNMMVSQLPPALQSALGAAVANAPAAGTADPAAAAPAANAQAEQPKPLVLSEIFSKDMRWATYAVELAFRNRIANSTLILPPNKPDQYLDHDTRHKIEDTVMENFKRYGSEYYTGQKLINGTDLDGNGTPDFIYSFDESGNIFQVVQNDDGTAKLDESGKPLLVGPSAVGHITDGIHVTDADGMVSKPHEAAVLFMKELTEQLTGVEVVPLSQDVDAADEEAAREIEEDLDKRISDFFVDHPDLESEYRGALRRLQGMDGDAFKNGDLARRIRDAKRDSGEDIDAFIMYTFNLEADRVGAGLGIVQFEGNAGEVSSIHRLLQVMSGDQYDPRVAAGIRDDSAFRDNILSLNGYEILRHMQGGEYIAIDALYDDNFEEQKNAILQEFDGKSRVTREEVHAFVRKQFELRAIQTLTGESYEGLNKDEQTAFIARHVATLDGVSQAMAEGRFNPYEKDVHLVFKAFERPGLNDAVLRNSIEHERSSGNIPKALFAMNNLSQADLAALSGNPNYDQLDRNAKEALLQGVFDKDIDSALDGLSAEGRAVYERVVLNFYEPDLANSTWWRNGELNDSTSDNTWNSRYGNPNQDQLMHMFVRYNWSKLDRLFGPEDGEKMTNIVLNTSRTSVNYNLSYDEVVAQLSPNARAILDKGIEDLNRPSMYIYMTRLRIDHYRDLRDRHYVPSLIDAKLTAEFAKTSPDPDAANNPDGTTPLDPGGDTPETDPSRSNPEDEAAANAFKTAAAIAVPTTIAARAYAAAANLPPEEFRVAIPEEHRTAAARAARAYEMADNATPHSEKYTRAMALAERIVQRTDLTEQQIRVYGVELGKGLIAESKITSADRALRALEIAGNAADGSDKQIRAFGLAERILQRTGMTETQLKLYSVAKADPALAAILKINNAPATIAEPTPVAETPDPAKTTTTETADPAKTITETVDPLRTAANDEIIEPARTAANEATETKPVAVPSETETLLENQRQRLEGLEERQTNQRGNAAANERLAALAEEMAQKEQIQKFPSSIRAGDNSTIIVVQDSANASVANNSNNTAPATSEPVTPAAEAEAAAPKVDTDAETAAPKTDVDADTTAPKTDADAEGTATKTDADGEGTAKPSAEAETTAPKTEAEVPKTRTNVVVETTTKLSSALSNPRVLGTIGTAAVGYSAYYAYSKRDEGDGALTARSAVTGLDATVAYQSLRAPSFMSNTLLRGGGSPLVAITTAVEVGIEISNKDGQAAAGATIIGGAAFIGASGGAALGSVVPILGTGIGALVGGVGGAVTGAVVVSYTEAENGIGRWYNGMIYNGSWFGDGMVKETEDIIAKAAQYKTRLDAGTLSEAELAEYRELLTEIEDHALDLQKAEAGLIHNLGNWQGLDTNADGQLTETEVTSNVTALKDFRLVATNRALQEQLTQTRAALSASYDTQKHAQLDGLLDGATNAADIQNKLKPGAEFAHVATSLTTKWQVGMWWNNQDDWRETLNEISGKITDRATSAFNVASLSKTEIIELKRDLHNTREEIEDRIQNLIYQASKGTLNEEEFDELRLLRDDLKQADILEDALWPGRIAAANTPATSTILAQNAQDVTQGTPAQPAAAEATPLIAPFGAPTHEA